MRFWSLIPAKTEGGFTLVEMLVVVAIFLILAAFTIPVGVRFFANQNLTSFSHVLTVTLRRTRTMANMQKQDSDWGVYIDSQEYVVFKGPSYEDASYKETYNVPRGVDIAEEEEIVFEKMTGLPPGPTSISISNSYQSNMISISEQGKINLSVDVSLASD